MEWIKAYYPDFKKANSSLLFLHSVDAINYSEYLEMHFCDVG